MEEDLVLSAALTLSHVVFPLEVNVFQYFSAVSLCFYRIYALLASR
jgi:hypothetical protein